MSQSTAAAADTADFDTRQRLKTKWRKMDYLRRQSVRPRQQACMLYPTGTEVSVRSSNSAGTGFSGLQSCGSVTCPNCGPKIMADRRADIESLIRWADTDDWKVEGRYKGKYRLLFGTFTVHHHLGQSMEAVSSVIAKSWASVTSGRQWKKDQADYGIAGWVRVWETKYSKNTGWHVHVHYLMLVEDDDRWDWGPKKHTEQLQQRLFARWARGAKKYGQIAPSAEAQDLRLVVGAEAAREFGKYLTKNYEAAIKYTQRKSEGSLSYELASHGTKRRLSFKDDEEQISFEPTELLEIAMAGDGVALVLWNEYEMTMEGKRTVGWSKGLRRAAGLLDEKTDQEIADEEAGDETDTVVSMSATNWKSFARVDGNRGKLLALVATRNVAEVLAFLRENGVLCWVSRPPE